MKKPKTDDEEYRLTPWGCLEAVLKDFGVDTSNVTGRMGELIIEDFMKAMVDAGYIKKTEENEKERETHK